MKPIAYLVAVSWQYLWLRIHSCCCCENTAAQATVLLEPLHVALSHEPSILFGIV